MVSAWASQNRLVLGQRKVDDKSNEITALLNCSKLSIVALSPLMRTQKEIAKIVCRLCVSPKG